MTYVSVRRFFQRYVTLMFACAVVFAMLIPLLSGADPVPSGSSAYFPPADFQTSSYAVVMPGAQLSSMQVFLVNEVIPTFGSILLTLLTTLVGYLIRRNHLAVSQTQVQRFDDVLAKAIAFSEERAASKVKSGRGFVSGDEKLSYAVSFAINAATALGLPKKLVDLTGEMIQAKLGATPGVGASK